MNIHTHKTKKQLQRLFALSFFLSLNKAPGRTDGMCGVGSGGQAGSTHILCSLVCSWFTGLFRALSITCRTTKVTLLSGISASPSVKRHPWALVKAGQRTQGQTDLMNNSCHCSVVSSISLHPILTPTCRARGRG